MLIVDLHKYSTESSSCRVALKVPVFAVAISVDTVCTFVTSDKNCTKPRHEGFKVKVLA